MKKFWFIYDLILINLTAFVALSYTIGFMTLGSNSINDYIFTPQFNNLYVMACAIRLMSKHILNKIG